MEALLKKGVLFWDSFGIQKPILFTILKGIEALNGGLTVTYANFIWYFEGLDL